MHSKSKSFEHKSAETRPTMSQTVLKPSQSWNNSWEVQLIYSNRRIHCSKNFCTSILFLFSEFSRALLDGSRTKRVVLWRLVQPKLVWRRRRRRRRAFGDSVAEVGSQRRERRRPRERVDVELCETENPGLLFGRLWGVLHLLLKHGTDLTPISRHTLPSSILRSQ